MYGANPQGLVIFDGHRHYALVNSQVDVPKYPARDSMCGTPDESRATVQGSIAHFGTYTINEADNLPRVTRVPCSILGVLDNSRSGNFGLGRSSGTTTSRRGSTARPGRHTA